MAGGVPPNQLCFGVVDDYLLIANRTQALERGIATRRQSSKTLKNELDFKLIHSKLRRQPSGKSPGSFSFARPEETFRAMSVLANIYRDQKRLEEVEKILLELVERKGRVFGAD